MWRYRQEPEQFRALAEVYWRGLLFLAGIIILGALAYGSFKLLAILSENKNTDALPPEGRPTLNRAELQAILDGFAGRKERYEFLKTNPPKVVDPSK